MFLIEIQSRRWRGNVEGGSWFKKKNKTKKQDVWLQATESIESSGCLTSGRRRGWEFKEAVRNGSWRKQLTAVRSIAFCLFLYNQLERLRAFGGWEKCRATNQVVPFFVFPEFFMAGLTSFFFSFCFVLRKWESFPVYTPFCSVIFAAYKERKSLKAGRTSSRWWPTPRSITYRIEANKKKKLWAGPLVRRSRIDHFVSKM